MSNISNNTKATLFLYDITSGVVPSKDKSYTVQSFDYRCERKRNTMGMPYGPTGKTSLRFCIKTLPDGYLKELYNRIHDHTPSSLSFVFNATFEEGPDGQLAEYETGMVVEGYVVNISEAFGHLLEDTADKDSLMLTSVEFLVGAITYMGSDNNRKTLYINF